MQILDMLGKPCPIPVVEAKKALAAAGIDGITVLVDNMAAVQNLERMSATGGYTYSFTQENETHFTVTISGGNPASAPPLEDSPAVLCPQPGSGLVVLVGSDKMGSGADELGLILIKGFIFSLTQLSPLPSAVVFLNSGAYLTAEGANTIGDLKTLEQNGTKILTCGTCANFYAIKEKLAVGEITDMLGITTTLAEAGKVISL